MTHDCKLNFKVVYALVSRLKDTYAEQCYLSVYSLRKFHPDAIVALVMDSDTKADLLGVRKELLEMTDEVHVVDFPEEVTPHIRSRLLKTSLRDTITGDFLYIDTDTIIVNKITGLNEYLKQSGDIFSVQDCHVPIHKMSPSNIEFHSANAKLMDYDLSKEEHHFFNSGVSLVKDSEKAKQFYKKWNEAYLFFLKKHNIKTDQATLCLTNASMCHLIQPMESKYNFQISATLHGLKAASIIHYFATGNAESGTVFPLQNNHTLKMLNDDKDSVLNIVDKCIINPANQIDYLTLAVSYIRYNTKMYRIATFLLKLLISLKVRLLKK